jgi:hypothetical protein
VIASSLSVASNLKGKYCPDLDACLDGKPQPVVHDEMPLQLGHNPNQ